MRSTERSVKSHRSSTRPSAVGRILEHIDDPQRAMTNPDVAAGLPHPSTAKRLLMVAYHFPPLAGSSGIQRTLRFAQQLPEHGWDPIVLSAHPRAYTAIAPDLLPEISAGMVVERAFALDTARHLSIAGRYPRFLAQPDRWRPWAWGAIPAGLRLIRRLRPHAIWSTYPIATAHLIAHRLHVLTGLPLVADFRDPMAQDGYPEDARTWRSFQRIEQDVARSAARLVFVTPSALALYRDRYPALAPDRFDLIENGYDEETFAAVERHLDPTPLNPRRFTLLHSGIVYPSERDPRALFAALGRMRGTGRIGPESLRIRFRAPVHDGMLRALAETSGTRDIVEILPAIGYREAIEEMLRADGLMVMQAANCNEQIPAKVYEYLRARRPIVGLADPQGDTAKTMLKQGVAQIAPLEDTERIEATLTSFLAQTRPGEPPIDMPPGVSSLSRRASTAKLAALLDAVCSEPARTQG